MYTDPVGSGVDPTMILILVGVWFVLVLAILAWYLWAMARLFPKIGLQKRDGWIPIWNQWKLLERGGMPGWTVLLSFVGLSIVPFVLIIIAINRIGKQAGAGIGYTILGAIFPPLWATLFANFIGNRSVTASGQSGGQSHAAYAQPGAQQAQPGFAAPGGGFDPSGAQPGFAAPAPAGIDAQGGFNQQGSYYQQGGFDPSGAQPGFATPAASVQPEAPAARPGFGQSAFDSALGNPFAAPPANDPYAQPVDPYAQPASQYAQPADPYAQPAGQAHVQTPADPYAQLGFDQLIEPAQPEQQANAGADQQWAAFANTNAVPDSGSVGHAPLGSETEGEYARLASEGFQAPPATPLGPPQTTSSFQWPGADQQQPAPSSPQHAAPEAPSVPPVHPLAAGAPASQDSPFAAAPEAAPAPPAVSVPAPGAPTPGIVPPPPAAEPSLFTSISDPGELVLPPNIPTPASAARKATGITGRLDPLPEALTPDAEPAEDLDRTVVAPRKAATQTWVLVLPDGSELPIENDVIVGRRPDAADGAAALAIPDSTRTLSKSHARLRFEGSTWTVEDLGSTNGLVLIAADGTETELNPGTRVEATERMLFGTLEVRLRPGGDAA